MVGDRIDGAGGHKGTGEIPTAIPVAGGTMYMSYIAGMKSTVWPLIRASLRPLAVLAAIASLTGCEALNNLDELAARGPRRWRVEVWSVPLPVTPAPGVMARDAEPPPMLADAGTEASQERLAPVAQARPSAEPVRGRQAAHAPKGQRVSDKKPVKREVRPPPSRTDRATTAQRSGKPVTPPARKPPPPGVRASPKRT